MSSRGTRGSQSMTNLSDMQERPARGRGAGRGRGRGYGQGRGRTQEERFRPQPLFEHPLPHPRHPHPHHPHARHPHPHHPHPHHPHARHPHLHPHAPHPPRGRGGARGYPPSGPHASQQHHRPPPSYHGNQPNASGDFRCVPPNRPNAPQNYPNVLPNSNVQPNYFNAAHDYSNAPQNFQSDRENYPNDHGHSNNPGNYSDASENYHRYSGSFPNAPYNNYGNEFNPQPFRGCDQIRPFYQPMEKEVPSGRSFLDVKDLLKVLIEAPLLKLSSETVLKKLKCSEKALDVVCAHNKKLISVCEGTNGMDVDLIPNIVICEEYFGSEGCAASEHCGKFHICKAFASGDCPESTKCEFGHVWKTSHNKKLFEEMMLDSFAEPLLKNLMKKVVLRKVGISVCKSYNEGTCSTGKQCHALHVCQKLLDGEGKCVSERCTLNHDIFELKCLSLLTIAGIDTNDSKRDILTKVRKLVQHSVQSTASEGFVNDANKMVSKKLDCFPTIKEQELAAVTVVESLVSTPNYWNFLDKLQELLQISQSDFLELLHLYKKTFLVYESNARTFVKLQPKLDLCSHYKFKDNCRSGKNCNFLHLCRGFIAGTCNDPHCSRLHKLNVSPNNEILLRHFLIKVPSELVINYLKTRFRLGALPIICFYYNDGNCSKKNCQQLHICYDVLFTLKSCYQQNCDKNHDILSDHNRGVLSAVADVGDHDIKTALSARLSQIPRMTVSNKDFGENSESAQKEWVPKSDRNSENNDTTAKVGGKEKPDQQSAKSSYQLNGDVIVPEICVDHIQDNCRPGTNMCPKLHARVAYHWQFSLNGTWHNFAFPHSNLLEKQFRDVSQTSVDLSPSEYGRTAQEKLTYSMMKDKGLTVDFDKMELSSLESTAIAVRRIGTPSSAITSSNYATVFGWFFEDKNGIWIEYGNCDSTGVERHSTTVTSMDIEKAYSSNPFTLQMATGEFTYTLNFPSMTQMNNKTHVVRFVRRRPKHVVIEKLKPHDPYGLEKVKIKLVSDDKIKSPSSSTVKSENTSAEKYPSFWAKMDGPGPKFYSVELNSDEGSKLVSKVLLSMPSAEILGIRRLQNTFHYQFFENQMNRIKAVTQKPVLNIQHLFHGTREKHVSSISNMNFEWRQEYADSGHKFGRGAYFFNNAALAHQFASNLAGEDASSSVVLAVAEVYVGTVALGDPSMVRPPTTDSGALADTTVDNLKVPSIFVKYNNKEYCPHYFINIKV